MINPTKQSDIKHDWHLVDAKDQVLGRLATGVATKLVGKGKSNFTRHLDCGDNVVVINAKLVKVTGKKEENKVYTRYSGYPGGLRSQTLGQKRIENPTEIIRLAVRGMLPVNKLRDVWLTRLHIYSDENYPLKDRIKNA